MDFLSGVFWIFCPLFFLLYYIIPKHLRYIVILIGSYVFYGYGNSSLCIFLVITTLITYAGGIVIEKKKTRSMLLIFYLANISILLVFKYTNFFIQNINSVSARLGGILHFDETNIILPVGLSFYIFQTCTYLMDIYRNRMEPERNLAVYAAFASFFPTILSGPIQKARELLPQIKDPSNYCEDEVKKGTILFIWGMFEKILVANNLLIIVNTIYGDLEIYNGIYYILAVCSFSLYIYADFSSYSDMARGISKIMGISISKNFSNPYLSLSTSEFWNRWHISLNDWFIENVYIPLGGNRKGILRKYVNVMMVFLVSGLWHGAAWHFVAWGLLNGIFVIIGQILIPLKQRILIWMRLDPNVESVVFLKRIGVFVLISLTWIFFKNGIEESMHIIHTIFKVHLVDFFNPNILNISGSAVMMLVTVLFTSLFCKVQIKRQNENKYYLLFNKQPELLQVILLSIIVVACIYFSYMPYADVDTQFLYFTF